MDLGYVVKCIGIKNGAVHCTLLEDSKSGTPGSDKHKVKGNIHWVSAAHAHQAEVRLYDRLFKVPQPEGIEHLNPESKKTIAAQLEPSLAKAGKEQIQFERHGYFTHDKGAFIRTVSLRDSWANNPATVR